MSIVGGFQTSKYYLPGLGYSPSSGQDTGLSIQVDPNIYSSTFFGSDVKSLLPLRFGRRKGSKKINKKKIRRSKSKSKSKSKKKNSRKTKKY